VEDVDDLGQKRDPRQQRDLLAGEADRVAAAVPVLVEIEDRPRHGGGKSHLPGDVGTAMAARLDEVALDIAAVHRQVQDRLQPGREARLHRGVGDDEAQHLRQAVVEQLGVALEVVIVGDVELADPRGIAAAAEIFQEQRVVEVGELRHGQAEHLADMHADPAAAHAVTDGLAVGHVQRVAERADDLGQSKGRRIGGDVAKGHGQRPYRAR
jgi:hypothetical protein